ncbi:KilA-N domain-containing protein [Agitococcus lubricus]|uniref:ORF6C domain-containing protein n=1 Tax=Agitococcus lubricus TaxID=1077255 RepID=A0A2T5ITB9_9GAMM|nr:KilA-N domain-containing protein [Agitococcus lubricus]PTQ87096.1 ORF6C domain-containing protein [Agitococcus lubricus]
MTTLAQNQSFEQTAIATPISFSILDNNIRVVDGLYSLNDLHKASGSEDKNSPKLFVRNQQTQDLINEISQGTDLHLAIKTVHGGTLRGTYVCRELVYAYAMWISAKFHLLVIRAFDAMYSQKTPILTTDLRFQIPDIIHELVSQGVAAKGTIYNRLYRRFDVNSYKEIPLEQCQKAIDYLKAMVKPNHNQAAIKINDGEHYLVVKNGVVIWEKMLKSHCNDIPKNTIKNPVLMLEHIREVVGEFVGQPALEHKPLESENNLVMISRDTTNKVMDYFAALRHEINRLGGKLPVAPNFDKEAIVRAVVTDMMDSSRMLVSFDFITGKPQITFVPNDCFVATRDNLAQVIAGGDGIPKKYLPDIIKAAVNRLSDN